MWTGKELRAHLSDEEYLCLSSEYDVSDEGNQPLFPGQVQHGSVAVFRTSCG